jgi:NhaA family Na+:H+ antiporter
LGRTLARAIAPIQAFLRLEAASSWLLLGSALLALAWANSPLAWVHRALFDHPLALGGLHATALDVIDEGLMALFFFLVGMEIKRELAVGELSSVGRAVLPGLAAIGGMLAPAAVYLAFNRSGPAARGWGVPMATDIAFAIGLLVAFRSKVPQALIAFLTALAIFDDLGGILVIALFYGGALDPRFLAVAAAITVALFAVGRSRRPHPLAFAVLGAALWVAFGHGGIHATMSGVVTGLLVPARASRACPESPLERWERVLHPWVAYLVVPLFALGNGGLSLSGLTRAEVFSPVAIGVTLALLVGKPLGILAFTLLGTRAKVAPLPGQDRRLALVGTALTGGIGFTVALLIAELAFGADARLLAQAKLGILAGSVLSAVAGALVLRRLPPLDAT